MTVNGTLIDESLEPLYLFWMWLRIWLPELISLAVRAVIAVLLILALLKYLRGKKEKKQDTAIKRSLGEILKEHRLRCSMTQEFVAEALGVSRQAVSKWENGTSDPSTSNLLKLADLFGVSPEELIRSIRAE